MTEHEPFKEELKFPVQCHYRIITGNIPKIDFVIETVLAELGVKEKLKQENQSSKGTYLSFGVDVMVPSREMMNKIDSELRAIVGVKMVL
jgi:putative lipoic acid-binding regulatory protein